VYHPNSEDAPFPVEPGDVMLLYTIAPIARRQQIYAIYASFFLAAHRAFINADNFFRMAAFIGFRPAVFF
jgi:hypothetical protein